MSRQRDFFKHMSDKSQEHSSRDKSTRVRGMLQRIKDTAGPLVSLVESANHRDRVRKIYDLAKELQDDLPSGQ